MTMKNSQMTLSQPERVISNGSEIVTAKSNYFTSAFVLLVLVPLLAGLTIYALWRGISFVDPQKQFVPLCTNALLPGWMLYTLPDALYAFALFNTMCRIWHNRMSPQGIVWCTGILFLLVTSEFFQKWHLIRGTYDWLDIVAYIAAACATVVIQKFFNPYKPKTT